MQTPRAARLNYVIISIEVVVAAAAAATTVVGCVMLRVQTLFAPQLE